VGDDEFGVVGGMSPVLLHYGRRMSANLVAGAGETNSATRECLVGDPDKLTPAGDFANGCCSRPVDCYAKNTSQTHSRS